MILLLRILSLVILVSMLGLTSWASLHTPLFSIPREVFQHPWFLATLADAYWAFIAFFVWVAWKERSAGARVLWFLALIALGNISIAVYFLRETWGLPRDATLDTVMTRRNPGSLVLPGILTALSVVVYLLA